MKTENRRFRALTFAVALPFGVLIGGRARAEEPAPPDPERVTPVVRVFRDCSPAVVNLSTTTVVTVQPRRGIDSIFEDIFELPTMRPRLRPERYEAHSVGSGFLIHADGYVVTNTHVIDRATEVKVTFADGTELAAEEVARDREHDLAVLKVDADRPLPFLKMGRSGDLMPGETVVAIGNPLGYQHTVTTGVVSALNRELRFGRSLAYTGLIQTDASINPGNSGGPLLNVLGELVGVNTAIRGDAQNIGFAIPVDRLHDLLPSMLDIQRLRRVEFGIHFDSASADGAVVKTVDAGSPAEKAGLRAGDVVVEVDGVRTRQFMDAFSVLNRAEPGRELKLEVVRDPGGKRRKFGVRMLDVPRLDAADLMERRFGIRVRELAREDLRRLGLRRPIGLFVDAVRSGSGAAGAGLTRGDIVTMFGGWPVTSLAALGPLMRQVNPGDRIPFQLLRIEGDVVSRAETALRAE